MINYKDDGIYKGFPTETDNGYKLSINEEPSYIKVKKIEIELLKQKIKENDERIKLLEEQIFNKIKKAGI